MDKRRTRQYTRSGREGWATDSSGTPKLTNEIRTTSKLPESKGSIPRLRRDHNKVSLILRPRQAKRKIRSQDLQVSLDPLDPPAQVRPIGQGHPLRLSRHQSVPRAPSLVPSARTEVDLVARVVETDKVRRLPTSGLRDAPVARPASDLLTKRKA